MSHNQEEKYAAALRELAGAEGRRNGMLLGVANLGLLARRSPAEVEADLLEAGAAGRSPLTMAEVRRAVQRAGADGYGSHAGTPRRIPAKSCGRASGPGRSPHPALSPRSASPAFMDAMTRRGEAEWSRWRDERLRVGLREWETPDEDLSPLAALRAFSPAPLDADTSPSRMAALQVAALFDDPGERVWAGALFDARNPSSIYHARDFAGRIPTAGPQIAPNPVTGEQGPTKNGDGMTYRGESTVAALRNAVVEFDGMDPPGERCRRQALFWLGVVTSRDALGRMPLPVRCIVFTGNKSLHAALRIDAANRNGWNDGWRRLMDAMPGADGDFRSPSQAMRLAGVNRGPNEKHVPGAAQSLVWCAPPPASGHEARNALGKSVR